MNRSIAPWPGARSVTEPGLTGVILAGGKSTRMGRDKALLDFGGVSFIDRIAASLSGVTEPVVISTGEGGRYPQAGLPVVTDNCPGCGALGGIQAVLAHMSTPRALFVPCDLPLVTSAACRRMAEAVMPQQVIVARCGGRLQPLFGIYGKEALPVIERCLASGRYSVMACLEELDVAVVDFSDPALLFNINTPDEYGRLLDGRLSPAGAVT